MNIKKITLRNWSLLFTAVLLASCQLVPSYEGKQVPPEERMILKNGGPHPGSWSGRDLIMTCTYQRSQTQVSFSGTIEFTGGVTNFPMISRFGMEIFFLDAQGIVIDAQGFYNAAYGRSLNTWRFKRQFELPPETVSVAFGYSGEAIEGGRNRRDRMDWYFWDSPFRSE